MRRMHWWSAAAGVGTLALAAAGAPAALAAHNPPAPRQVVTSSRNQAARVTAKHHDDDRRHHRPHCDYPPHGRADVSISAKDHVHNHEPLTITGAMTVNGCGYDKFAAGLYTLVPGPHRHGGPWVQLATTTTGDQGAISFTVQPTGTAKYRIMTAPGDGLSEGWSDAVQVEVHIVNAHARH